jgi:glycosyltransferase involved in cell wall biosynthesis
MKVVIITNIPAPYRVKVFEKLANFVDLSVIFCARGESNRSWKLPKFNFRHIFLKENFVERKSKDTFVQTYVHNNFDVFFELRKLKPDIVITSGFNPTHIYAFIWAKLNRSKHICMTDGTVDSESGLTYLHNLIRKVVFFGSHAFIAASEGGIKLYKSFSISTASIFKSQLCANNNIFFKKTPFKSRNFDVLFSGQFQERKMPFLFAEICNLLVEKRGKCKALLIGDGPLREDLLRSLSQKGVDFHYAGFVDQDSLPNYYSASKVLLFTTRMDAWGVVANEAMAAGTPVITSPFAGVANELVINNVTGAVCELKAQVWCNAVERLLDDPNYWLNCSNNARNLVATYNYENAAKGIISACRFSLRKRDF